METIKQVLMRRDKMSEADDLIEEAKAELDFHLHNGDMDYAENICADYFGLEPDYLEELL